MFWGLIMEPGKVYTQEIQVPFHISCAAIDVLSSPAASSDKISQVMCKYEGRNYLLCSLNSTNHLQCPLDLNFAIGSTITFAVNGGHRVHLTGYLTEFEDDFENDELDEDDVIEESKKRLRKSVKQALEGSPDQPPKKKKKIDKKDNLLAALAQTNEIADSDEDDSDFNLGEESDEGEEIENDESDEVEGEEDSEDDEDDDDDDDEEEAEDEEDESDDEPAEKPKLNGVGKKENKKEKTNVNQKSPAQQSNSAPGNKQKLKKMVLKGGVIAEDLKEGTGDVAKPGKFAHVYYEGRLKDNNKMFDSSTKGPGFRFRIGKGEVIKGWDIGVSGMKVGGKRRIICPPNSAYGAKGSPPVIPPNSTLVFDVELKKLS